MSLTSGRTLGLLAIASVVYYVLVVLAMHVLQPELNPLHTPMSVYVLGDYGFLMTTTYFASSAGFLGVGFGLSQTLPRTRLTGVALAATVLASTGSLVAGIFPTDWPPPMRSTSGQLHELAGLVTFPAVIIAPVLFSLKFWSDEYWRRVSVVALGVSAGIVAACAVFWGLIAVAISEGVVDRPPDFLGLVQRISFGLFWVWMIVVGRHLTRAPRAT